MDWIIAYLLMVITTGIFYFFVYKRNESFIIASWAVLYYFTSFTALGMIVFNLESIFSYLFSCSFSSSVFEIIFSMLKMIYFISIPMPVILTIKKIKRGN